MFCPSCGKDSENKSFCPGCHTNLVLIGHFLAREDSQSQRSHVLSRTGLVSIIISEGFAWTLGGLFIFLLVIFLATLILPRYINDTANSFIIVSIFIVLVGLCGIPLMIGLVLLLKDVTLSRPKPPNS